MKLTNWNCLTVACLVLLMGCGMDDPQGGLTDSTLPIACASNVPVLFADEAINMNFSENVDEVDIDYLSDPELFFDDPGSVSRDGNPLGFLFTAPSFVESTLGVQLLGKVGERLGRCGVILAPDGKNAIAIPSNVTGPFTLPSMYFYSLGSVPSDTPNFDPAAATNVLLFTEINFSTGGNGIAEDFSGDISNFGLLIEGNFQVTTHPDMTGNAVLVSFQLSSDDGSYLDVDGQQIIDNGGNHSYRKEGNTVSLTPGTHTIRLRYHQGSGSGGLKLEWKLEDDAYQVFTASDIGYEQGGIL